MFSALVGFFSVRKVSDLFFAKSITRMSSVAYVMLSGARDRSYGLQAIGASITTMLQHISHTGFRFFFLRKTRLLWFVRLLTLLRLLAVPKSQEAIEKKIRGEHQI